MNIKISQICNSAIRLSYLILFFLTPLVFTSFNSELFEFTKMILVYVLTIIIFCCWITRMITEKKLIFKRTFWDFPLILFFIAICLSTIFSHDLYMSLFGYYSRFHQGLFSLVAFLILYWAFVSNIGEDSYGFRADSIRIDTQDIRKNPLAISGNPGGYINKLILTITMSSLIVATYGVAQHFGLDFFRWVQDVQFRVFSSMGQPNWLGAYLAIVLILQFSVFGFQFSDKSLSVVGQSVKKTDKQKTENRNILHPVVTFTIFAILYTCLLFTRSRSAFTAFHVCFSILTIILFRKCKKIFIAVYLIFIILINMFNILPTPIEKINGLTIPNVINNLMSKTKGEPHFAPQDGGASRGEGGTESFSIRRIVWKGAWNAYLANPIFGYGNETFALAYYRYKPIEQNLVSEWDFLYNKAHNEYLNYLATTGIVGFLAYLVLIFSFIFYAIRVTCHSCPATECGVNSIRNLNLALFLAWITILITNFVGFSVVAISLFFYLIPAIMVVINENSQFSVFGCQSSDKSLSIVSQPVLKTEKLKTDKLSSENRKLKTENREKILQFILFFFLLLTTYYLLLTICRWWLADIHFARAQAASSQNEYNLAFQEHTNAIELSPYHPVYHGEFSVTLSEMASYFNTQKEKSLAKSLVEKAIDEGALAVSISPNNPIFRNYQALIFHNLAFANKKYSGKAVDSILASYALSPNDPKITYYMAIYLLNDGQIKRAMKAFEITQKLKPNYVEAMSNYAKLLADTDKREKARQILEKLLKYYPGNTNITKLIKTYKE